MKHKALFFDIDGTLVSFNTHSIPSSTVKALEKARALGHDIFISTGRPKAIINNLGPIEHLISGYITMNGAATIVNDRVIASTPIAPEDVRRVLAVADKLDASCIVVDSEKMGMYNPHPADIATFERLIGIPHVGRGIDMEQMLKGDIFQMTLFVGDDAEKAHSEAFANVETARWCPPFFDITARGVDKGNGVKALCANFDIPIEDTIAFGDGGNDIPMLKAAGTAVAMGNANPELKAVADLVTTDVDSDGIANALATLLPGL